MYIFPVCKRETGHTHKHTTRTTPQPTTRRTTPLTLNNDRRWRGNAKWEVGVGGRAEVSVGGRVEVRRALGFARVWRTPAVPLRPRQLEANTPQFPRFATVLLSLSCFTCRACCDHGRSYFPNAPLTSWPLQDMVLLLGFSARINHPSIAPSHQH